VIRQIRDVDGLLPGEAAAAEALAVAVDGLEHASRRRALLGEEPAKPREHGGGGFGRHLLGQNRLAEDDEVVLPRGERARADEIDDLRQPWIDRPEVLDRRFPSFGGLLLEPHLRRLFARLERR